MKSIFYVICLVWSGLAFGHAMIDATNGTLQPRTTNNGQLKLSPCGGLPRVVPPASNVLAANSQFTFFWTETIQHPGRYLIQFSTGDESIWQDLLIVQDTQDNGNTPHFYNANITIPDVSCETCILRLVQVMTENPNMDTFYYNCADVNIVGGSQFIPPFSQDPPNPDPDPGSNCH